MYETYLSQRFDEVYWSVSFDGLSLISDGDQIDLIKVKHGIYHIDDR